MGTTMTLREALFLLAHHPSGRPRIPHYVLEAGLAAAALMELRHLGAIEVTGDGHVVVRSPSPGGGDPLLERLLRQLTEGPPRRPHELLPELGGDVEQVTLTALVSRGHCRLDAEAHLVAVGTAGHRDDARNAMKNGAGDLGALVWATELSGHVLGPAALVTRLRLGRQAAGDPLALAVRQVVPLTATRFDSNPGLS